ncbi:MAG: hypothetical protein DBX51_00270 [Clostridiales bacterium]|nr:MAG: hypothetical protein DBX51_00270 [Clostridiales bacterium]
MPHPSFLSPAFIKNTSVQGETLQLCSLALWIVTAMFWFFVCGGDKMGIRKATARKGRRRERVCGA